MGLIEGEQTLVRTRWWKGVVVGSRAYPKQEEKSEESDQVNKSIRKSRKSINSKVDRWSAGSMDLSNGRAAPYNSVPCPPIVGRQLVILILYDWSHGLPEPTAHLDLFFSSIPLSRCGLQLLKDRLIDFPILVGSRQIPRACRWHQVVYYFFSISIMGGSRQIPRVCGRAEPRPEAVARSRLRFDIIYG